jgi:hypothetical protein
MDRLSQLAADVQDASAPQEVFVSTTSTDTDAMEIALGDMARSLSDDLAPGGAGSARSRLEHRSRVLQHLYGELANARQRKSARTR